MAVRETPSPHSHPPLSSPVGSRVRSEDAMPSPAPPAQPWSQVSVAPHTQTPLRDALPFESGPWAPLRCPTAGTSMSPLVPLVRPLGAWLELPRPSRWLLRTIRLGYAIQFARRPPKFRGNRFTSVLSQDAPVLRAEVAVLLAKDAIQPAPPAEMESGLYKGPYFIVPEKHGGLHPIWDLRVLNRALVKLPFKMLTQRRLFQCVRPFDWVAAIDLKDAYFHVSILPRFRFAYKGASIPVGPPLRAPQPVGASGQPGKEQTLPYAEDLFSRQGVGLGQPHSTSLRGACSVNAEMPGVSPAQEGGSTETFSEAPGAYGILSRYHAARIASYETASALASRPSPEMGMAPRHIPGLTHPVLPSHLQPMVGSCFLRAEVPLEQVSRHVVVSTDASATGWGAMCNGHAAAGLWTGPQLQWHINCLELLAVWLALRRFRTLLHEKHILVRSDNTATVVYINHQGDLRSRRMSQLARHLLLWSQKHLRSLRAVHVPGELNRAADELSRQHALPGEWRLHPEVLQLIWRRFGDAQVDLLPPRTRLTASCFSPCPRGPSVQMHWHAAGLGAYANMRFPQWAFSHRPCARSGRTRSKSSWLRLTGPIGRGSQNWCSSRQPLLGKFLWGGIYFLREGAPSGTRAQTCGISTYGPWTGRGGSKWATSSGSKHYHFCQGPVYETGLQAEVEPVRRLVFSPPGGPP